MSSRPLPARPLIGISSYLDEASWGVWNQPAALIPQSYVSAVTRAGGIAVLLPPQEDGAREAIAAVGGLVLSGGPDLNPGRYGADPHPLTGTPNDARDAWELALLAEALARDVPVLGVCRGMQLLNVARGGALLQHLPDGLGDTGHQPAPATYGSREVRVRGDSRLAAILGSATVPVRCYHHQAIAELGRDLLPVAWCADETIEAIEVAGRRFAFGVQWHPEADPSSPSDRRLFEALVAEARTSPDALDALTETKNAFIWTAGTSS
jgi:anthranilate synthase component 2/putative glutamine amidotransferase